jgi:DNA-binding MurR/RpiR family transcriptional regulator
MSSAGSKRRSSAKQEEVDSLPEDSIGYSMPKTYEELRAVLSSGSTRLPKRLKQVAVFMWQHPADVALGSISSVADQAGVQPSTLVRFSKVFGYSGFSDFQEIFKNHLKVSGLPNSGNSTNASISNGTGKNAVSGLVEASQRALTRLEQNFNSKSFAAIIKALSKAEIVYLIGSKRAFPIVTYLSMTLSQQGVRNILVDNIGSLGFDQISCSGRRDAVLAINFSPYNSITPELVKAAKQNGSAILSITDSAFSPLVSLADHYVEVVETEYAGFRTLSGTMTVAMAVVLGLADYVEGKARKSGK